MMKQAKDVFYMLSQEPTLERFRDFCEARLENTMKLTSNKNGLKLQNWQSWCLHLPITAVVQLFLALKKISKKVHFLLLDWKNRAERAD